MTVSFAWHSEFFRALGTACRDVILYNLPGQTAVTISHELVARLRKAHPGIVIGVKDSSGVWPYTERMLNEHGDIAILIGDERHLAKAVRLGGTRFDLRLGEHSCRPAAPYRARRQGRSRRQRARR